MEQRSLAECLARYNEEDLRKCFDEYEDLNETGVLKDGTARSIEKWYKKRYGAMANSVDVLKVCQIAVYYEMALRFYKRN